MLTYDLIAAISKEIIRTVTGQLFTDREIRAFSTHTVGKYFSDWLPEPQEEKIARKRVEAAREHIREASTIITAMQIELVEQTQKLDLLLEEIEEKKVLAERYTQLVNTNQAQFAAFRQEMEESLRKQLIAQSKQGRRLRQAASAIISLITLLTGAALGAYFKDIVQWAQKIMA